MNRYIFLVLTLLSLHGFSRNCNSFDVNSIDSIYVLHVDFEIYTTVAVPRYDFENFWINHGKELHIYSNKDSIEKISFMIEELEQVMENNLLKKMPYEYMKKIVKRKNGRITFVDVDPLNVRTQILLFYKERCKIVWISQALTDIENCRFYTSETLTKWLQNNISPRLRLVPADLQSEKEE